MPKTLHKAGDTITLKSRNHGDLAAQQAARIVAVLPETQGSQRFRVRLDGEHFDRSVSADDIDSTASSRPTPDVASHSPAKSGGWINHDLVRTKK